MRYVGTLMVLAAVGMLLFPSLWEGRWPFTPGVSQSVPDPGRSTLSADDLVPAWRGPRARDEKDG
jgi:hypothetical protein